MAMAQIFKPLRHHQPDAQIAESGASREDRVGPNPVTNTAPPGTVSTPSRAAQEEGWLALLELVFEETGWPDAE